MYIVCACTYVDVHVYSVLHNECMEVHVVSVAGHVCITLAPGNHYGYITLFHYHHPSRDLQITRLAGPFYCNGLHDRVNTPFVSMARAPFPAERGLDRGSEDGRLVGRRYLAEMGRPLTLLLVIMPEGGGEWGRERKE